MNSASWSPVFSSCQPSPEATGTTALQSRSRTYSVLRFQSMTCAACLMLMGRGFPSSPMRPQSHILNVKMFGVALISSTREPEPEQWIVPPGIR